MSKVIVDTSVWSLALRRRAEQLSPDESTLVTRLRALMIDDLVVMLGPIRQELLSGIRSERAFETLRSRLTPFSDEPLTSHDYVRAADMSNRCRRAGIAGSAVDLLICAVAADRGASILTTDRDFVRYANVLPVRLS